MAHWVAVVNANAGSSDDPALDEALEVLRADGSLDVHRTEDADDLVAAVEASIGGVLAVVGGDGSIHAVVNAADRAGRLDDVEIAIVPLGTGNDFVRTIGVVADPVEAAHQAVTTTARAADVVRDDQGGIVVNAAHVGIGAEANLRAEPWKKVLGPVGYAVGAIVSGVTGKGFHADVRVDGAAVELPHRLLQVAVGNGRYVGGGAPLLPDADPFDGRLDVAISWSEPRLRRLAYAWRLRKGRHPMRDDVIYRKAERVEVTGEPTPVNIDGEVCGEQRRHTWTVEPGRLRLRAPAAE